MEIKIKTKEICIEAAKIGDFVLAYDKDKKVKCYREITHTHKPIVKTEDQIAIKLLDGSTIFTSLWHPTLVEFSDGNYDYVRADELVVGDNMINENNELVPIIELWQPNDIDENYADLTVDEHHNYFTTSNDGIKYVIHNTLAYHTLLQEKGIPFEGLQSQGMTRKIFSHIKLESERASRDLAREYGEPLWCRGTGMRNTHLRAIAPTVSNSKLSGNVSAGIEPWAANVFTEQTSRGTFIRKNPTLEKFFKKMKRNAKEVWDQILIDGGSVQGLEFLDDWFFNGEHLINKEKVELLSDIQKMDLLPFKEVFKTFKEINQLELVKLAGIRQPYIDQGVSLNLAFPTEATPKFINTVHMEAYKQGVKSLYYMRTESVLRGDIASKALDENCLSCDG
jgi:hypothetical protein